jgi:2-polyprenyl-3-methyl-5-hydroxy-6-metoxy-1,4-benzoquinol methylase
VTASGRPITAVLGEVASLTTEGQLADALQHVLVSNHEAEVLLLGAPEALDDLVDSHVRSGAALTVVVAEGEGSGLVSRGFNHWHGPRGFAGAAISRSVAETFLSSTLQHSTVSTALALPALARAHGFDVAQVVNSSAVPDQRRRAGRTSQGFSDLRSIRRRSRLIARSYRHDQTEWSQRSSGFAGQGAQAGSSYAGSQELHSLSKAVRFHRWIAELLGPAIGKEVLEVGAGIGTMTLALAHSFPQANILSIEPDPALYGLLNERVNRSGVETATASTHELAGERQFDSVLYVNVLEHIEDHVGELRRASALLRSGGNVGIVVPAVPRLYGSLDAKTGHFRRYEKRALQQVAEQAGLVVTNLHYFDVVGVIPYWASVKVGAMPALNDRTTYLFDNVLVPMSKVAHKLWKQPPIGKNLLMVARKL